MESSLVSPMEALNSAIQTHNPFSKAGIVKEQDVWCNGFPDVSTLNAHASEAVFQAVEKGRISQSSQDKVSSLTITAQQGVGKSHIISRIRQHLESEGGASFVYASVNNYTDLNLILYQFQQTLADSLSHIGSQGVMQWQEVATAIANEGFKAINSTAPNLSPQELIERFDKVAASWMSRNKNFMNTLSQKVLQAKPISDPYILRSILWTLSESQCPFAIKWLSGEELDQSKAQELGLPANSGKTNQDREAEALGNIKKILNLVSYYNPVIICFDEIDVNTSCRDDGFTTPQVIADLVKRLYDTLEHSELGQGIVIITVMLPDTWKKTVNLMPGGIPDRVSTYTNRQPIELKHLNGDSLVELVQLWLNNFYETKKLIPPHPIYPFEESQLKDYGRGKPTVREALIWCAENFKVDEQALPEDPRERFELALQQEGEADLGDYLEDNYLIADALRFGFKTLIGEVLTGQTSSGETLNEVVIQEITDVKPISKNRDRGKGFINFRIIGKEKDQVFKIGLAVLQYTRGIAVGAGLLRLLDYQTFDLTRGCLVRSYQRKIKKSWQAYEYINQLTQELGGEWVNLEAETIRPLIDLFAVYQERERYQLSEEQVIEFSKPKIIDNFLLLEILSNPSGVVDEEAIEGEQLLEDFLNPSSLENTSDEDALNDLFS